MKSNTMNTTEKATKRIEELPTLIIGIEKQIELEVKKPWISSRIDTLKYEREELLKEYLDLNLNQRREQLETEEKDRKAKVLDLFNKTDKEIEEAFLPLNQEEMDLLTYTALKFIKENWEGHRTTDIFRALKEVYKANRFTKPRSFSSKEFEFDYDGK